MERVKLLKLERGFVSASRGVSSSFRVEIKYLKKGRRMRVSARANLSELNIAFQVFERELTDRKVVIIKGRAYYRKGTSDIFFIIVVVDVTQGKETT